ncbi:PQQ-dependent sugar dehydrogenase [Sinomicrobium weinanense]|uniref:PQQ-dependent sugar dehydrogenase n=1 Tax=Sinomicrobium weinanense TaxID=2842200 RepID=A0A926JU97_9FLAO|nr:PQQ-dependent sugar dehydrogenase [Sinomicrobium weinanense]MBC9797491.1 PQQ-dependent sugar dehydrogenase [Sinomicrobium weinanense]MBU3122223.1 PQQ-dependent sugar dehydrogenase [Sinomicrobium weinanense]
MTKISCAYIPLAVCIALNIVACSTKTNDKPKTILPDKDNAELQLPEGFGALKVADSIGEARHLVVNDNGDILVKLNRPKDGKGIVILSDEDKDGRADRNTGFGDYGGTGIALKGEYLYASSNTSVFRYPLNENQLPENTGTPDTIVHNLIDRGQHNSKSIVLDNNENLYVNIGAYSNACQERDRTKDSPGMYPCPILDSAGGIWKFKARMMKQSYGQGTRYATGLRNVVGLDWNTADNTLYVMQHGRDNLHDLFPELYDSGASAELPAEALYKIEEGDDAGWPYVYYDRDQGKNVLGPEFGGDGKKEPEEGKGKDAIDPLVAFPAHIAPNGLLFYTGSMFPEKYKNGAFIAFHGSWNRAPEKQEGFMVAFVPFKSGKPAGPWEIFADGFAGKDPVMAPGEAKHRPCGLAQGPDGSLYVSDDAGGTIYRILYNGKE